MVDARMGVLKWLHKQLAEDARIRPGAVLERMAAVLMGAEADAICGAPYGEGTPSAVDSRNG